MPKTLFQTVRREYLKFHLRLNPQQSLFFGFFMYMVLGWIFLSLPFSQKIPTDFIDTLFTSTSALSTTGLATVSTFDNYTFFGQFIILTLIQIGGIGSLAPNQRKTLSEFGLKAVLGGSLASLLSATIAGMIIG